MISFKKEIFNNNKFPYLYLKELGYDLLRCVKGGVELDFSKAVTDLKHSK